MKFGLNPMNIWGSNNTEMYNVLSHIPGELINIIGTNHFYKCGNARYVLSHDTKKVIYYYQFEISESKCIGPFVYKLLMLNALGTTNEFNHVYFVDHLLDDFTIVIDPVVGCHESHLHTLWYKSFNGYIQIPIQQGIYDIKNDTVEYIDEDPTQYYLKPGTYNYRPIIKKVG